MQQQAEKLKVRFGSALADEVYDNRIITISGLKGRQPKEISEKNLAHVIQARVEEILDYVLWELRRSGYENKLIGGIVLTGGGALLNHIDKLTEYHTGINTRIGLPVEQLAHGYSDQLSSPVFATAVGLLLKGIKDIEDGKVRYKEEVDPVKAAEELEEVGTSSKWLDNIFQKTKEWFHADPDSEF